MVVSVGDAAGHQVGEAQVEGTMEAGQQPVVSFQVTETLLGTTEDPALEVGPAAVALHASPQLAEFDAECMPGIPDAMKAFMATREARYWLHQFMEGMATEDMISNRFGMAVLETFQMWIAIRDDVDMQVRNCGDTVRGIADAAYEEGEEGSEATTVAVGRDEEAADTMLARKGYIEPTGENAGARDSEHEESQEREADEVAAVAPGVISEDREGQVGVTAEALVATGAEGVAGMDEMVGHGVPDDRESEHVTDEAVEGHGEAREEDDQIDPLTGIPAKWAAFWRATNANASIGAGLPGPSELARGGSLSDGLDTLPGNTLASSAQQENIEEMQTSAAAATSSSDPHTTSSSDGKRQTDLKDWLK